MAFLAKGHSHAKNIKIQNGCLYWEDAPPICVSALLSLMKEEKNSGRAIVFTNTGDDWRLYLRFQDGGSLSMEMELLLEYSVFAPLV